jgi:hypothetical protein
MLYLKIEEKLAEINAVNSEQLFVDSAELKGAVEGGYG